MKPRAGDYERDAESGLLLPRHARRGLARAHPQFMCGPAFFGGADSDPYWSSVVSLLHFDGSDGSTTFTDQTGKTWTAAGNAQIDTAQSKFGGASGLFDGTGDWISTPDSADFTLSSDFTIECFVRLNTITGGHHIIGKYESGGAAPFAIYQDNSQIGFYSSSDGNSWNLVSNLSFGASFSTGVWYHIAVTRAGDVWRTFLDGTLANSVTVAGTPVDNTAAVYWSRGNTGTPTPLDGWIDEGRITKGVARYTANFTPPSAPFPNS